MVIPQVSVHVQSLNYVSAKLHDVKPSGMQCGMKIISWCQCSASDIRESLAQAVHQCRDEGTLR